MNEQKMISIPLVELKLSPLNPRKHFNQDSINELAASMKQKGILQPLVARRSGKDYEIVFGARRFKAAEVAGIAEVPVIVKELNDQEVLEIQIIENSQREDIHPLEEAEGYFTLSRQPGYNAAKIASKIGRSEKYVYDRVKLYVSLIKEAKDHFMKNDFTAGHAILLARLSPADQKHALDPYRHAVFENDGGQHFFPNENPIKPRSVREFQVWINTNVRFQRDEVDPMLFPETAKTLSVAKEKAEKIVPITDEHFVQTSARAKERTISPQSWKRADGKAGSKICDHSVTGVFVVGPGRGDAVKVCIAKEKCKVHWGQWQKDREKSAKQRANGASGKDQAKQAAAAKQAEEAQKNREARMKRYDKAKPVIYKAVSEVIKKLPVGPNSKIAEVLIKGLRDYSTPKDKDLLPRGKTSEDLLRYAVNIVVASGVSGWNAHDSFPAFAKKNLGIDVWKMINEAYPAEKPKTEKPAKKKERKTQKQKVEDAIKGREAVAKEKREEKKASKKS